MLLPDVLYYVIAQPEIFDVEFSLRHMINPFRTLTNWPAVERLHWTPYVFAIGAAGFFSYALLFINARIAASEKRHAVAAD
jgi:hypothetical protein